MLILASFESNFWVSIVKKFFGMNYIGIYAKFKNKVQADIEIKRYLQYNSFHQPYTAYKILIEFFNFIIPIIKKEKQGHRTEKCFFLYKYIQLYEINK